MNEKNFLDTGICLETCSEPLGNRMICLHLFCVNWENVFPRRIFNVL